MTGFANGDVNYHDHDRREQWYNNKELFEKMEKMAQQFTSMEKSLIRLESKFEKYNGLHDKIYTIESRPCRQEATIDKMAEVVREVSEYIKKTETAKKTVEQAREEKYKKAAFAGVIVGIIGGILGMMAILGVL